MCICSNLLRPMVPCGHKRLRKGATSEPTTRMLNKVGIQHSSNITHIMYSDGMCICSNLLSPMVPCGHKRLRKGAKSEPTTRMLNKVGIQHSSNITHIMSSDGMCICCNLLRPLGPCGHKRRRKGAKSEPTTRTLNKVG